MDAANAAIATVAVKQVLKGKGKKKTVNVLKAALLTLFGRRKSTKCIQAEVVNNWAMLMRPMNQLEDKDSTLMLPEDETEKYSMNQMNEEEKDKVVAKNDEEEHDVKKLPLSCSSSECGGDSRYASALNLQELDKSGSSDDDDDEFDDTQGDAMIDMKAEMFIAQFYAQMRVQNIITSSS